MNAYLYGFIAFQLLLVAWIDLKSKVISNYWHLLNVGLGIGLYVLMPESYQVKWQVLLFPAGFVLGGFLLFLVGIMGAGDSKYLASLFLVVPLEFHLPFFEMILLGTVFVGGVILVFRVARDFKKIRAYAFNRHWRGIRDVVRSEFSYAPVIFLAWILLGVKQWT